MCSKSREMILNRNRWFISKLQLLRRGGEEECPIRIAKHMPVYVFCLDKKRSNLRGTLQFCSCIFLIT